MNVLLFEPDSQLRSLVGEIIRSRGHEVTAPADGAEVLESLDRERFPIVLTRWDQSTLPGALFSRILRSAPGGERPVLLVLGADPAEDPATFLAAGADGYLPRPLETRTLEAQLSLAEALAGERGRRAMLFDVTRLLAEAASLQEVSSRFLETLCGGAAFEAGELWRVDPAAVVLRCEGHWSSPWLAASGLDALARESTYGPGAGLVGRVWARGRAGIARGASADAADFRESIARKLGLRGAVAFPVANGSEVVGVLELFRRAPCLTDVVLDRALAEVASQLALFLRRRKAEEELGRSEERCRSLAATVSPADFAVVASGW